MNSASINDLIVGKITGEWGKEPTSGGVNVIRTTNFRNDGMLDLTNVVVRDIPKAIIQKKRLLSGDIIIEKSGGSPAQPVGRVVYFDIDDDNTYLCNNFTSILRPSKNIDSRYLFLALYYLHLTKRTLRYQNKTTGIINLQLERYLNNEKVNTPSIGEQKEIVSHLDQANSLRQKRKQSIDLLDEYLKSIFLEMFGDPVTNPKGWQMKTIEQLVKKDRYSLKRGPFGGALKKDIFVDKGYLVYEQYHALNNDFTMARYFINEEKFNEMKAFEVKAGDIIISCSGVYLGKLAIVPKNSKKGIINQALLKISLDNSLMNNILFTYIFSDINFKSKYFGYQIGSGIPNFPAMSEFKRFKFICPPLDIQEKFAQIVSETEVLKQKMLEQSIELDNQFNSLMQKHFNSN